MTLQEWLTLLGAIAAFITLTAVPAVVAIINAVNKNTVAVTTGNAEAAVADAQKIALSARIAEPFAPVVPNPFEERLKRIEELLATMPR
mgnify:CR=1 FL=1